jgi:cytidylate kinase
MIYLLYGQPASGKTTLGKLLAEHLDTPFIIDGDEFREMFTNTNYGREGREENIRNAKTVATYLNKKGKDGNWKAVYINNGENSWKSHLINKETHVVMCLVNPYKHLRDELRQNNIWKFPAHDDGWVRDEVVEVLLHSSRKLRKEYHVQDFESGDPNCILWTDQEVNESWDQLKALLEL